MFNIFSRNRDGIDISTEEFQERIAKERGVVIDVRSKAEYEEGHIAVTDQQLDVMNGEFQEGIRDLDKNQTYYLYCRSGNRSGQAARLMKQEGFENVFNVGGFGELVRAGFEEA